MRDLSFWPSFSRRGQLHAPPAQVALGPTFAWVGTLWESRLHVHRTQRPYICKGGFARLELSCLCLFVLLLSLVNNCFSPVWAFIAIFSQCVCGWHSSLPKFWLVIFFYFVFCRLNICFVYSRYICFVLWNWARALFPELCCISICFMVVPQQRPETTST